MKLKLLNLFAVCLLLAIPYFLFHGKLYVGGDDTRLMYSYPLEYLKNATFYSWYSFSSLGWSFTTQATIPIVTVWAIFEKLIQSKIIISYFSFSLPLILGLIYFQKLSKEVTKTSDKYQTEILIGSIFYTLSPIIAYDQLFIFLSNVWLIGMAPIMVFYLIRYLRTSNSVNIYCAMAYMTVFSIVSFAIPWILGLLLPILLSVIICFFVFSKKETKLYMKRLTAFLSIIILSQSFWIFGFVMTYLDLNTNSFAAKAFSKSFIDTFSPSVITSATGNIFYPLMNLFHRQIAFDFSWDLKNVFLSFYDKIIILDFIFIFILYLGLSNYSLIKDKAGMLIFKILGVGFLTSLFLFTVNIGPLKDLFLFMGKVPGFVMFRNFSDKFSFGFVFIYSLLITFCLVIANKKNKNLSSLVNATFFIVVVINFLPISKIVNAPLWKTNNIYKNITIPTEYILL